MSHGIQKPYDLLFSTKGAEWHGLATVVPFIDAETVKSLLFPIRCGEITVDLGNGRTVKMGNHKALVADLSDCRPDLLVRADESDENSPLIPGEFSLAPLHIPKKSYRPIENAEVWGSMETALRESGIDAEVSCVGTLEGCKKFFISVSLRGDEGFKVNGDDFLANLNFVTSHDGTLAVKAYDSTVRIVCMNTLRWSLEAAGEVGFNVYHTAGAETAMTNLGPLVAQVLSGRATFKNQMEYLATVECNGTMARQIALGYFAKTTGEKEVAKRSINAADEISTLFSRGKGNNGRTMYDLLNGATEYWTNGDGTGKKETLAGKAYKANFGTAADHKDAFANFLMSEESRTELAELGREAESIAAQAEKTLALQG